MARQGAALAVIVMTSALARADEIRFSERWHEIPAAHHLKMEDQLAEHLTELGNFIGQNVNVLSDDIVALKFDGRHQRARFRLGTGDNQHLHFNIDTKWQFTQQGVARIAARIDLGLGTHQFHLELPEMEMQPTSYHGEQGVVIRLPLFERRW